MKKLSVLLFVIFAATGCSTNHYHSPRHSTTSALIYADVISYYPNTVSVKEPEQVCRDTVVYQDRSATGAIAGALVGGALGSMVGSGSGKKIAIGAGAATGAVLGDRASGGYRHIRNCTTMTRRSTVQDGWIVEYMYQGIKGRTVVHEEPVNRVIPVEVYITPR